MPVRDGRFHSAPTHDAVPGWPWRTPSWHFDARRNLVARWWGQLTGRAFEASFDDIAHI